MRFTRRPVLLVLLALFLALDAGRSLYARVGAATPVRLWSPDPTYAVPIAWPPGSDLPADTPLGKTVYARRCAICHGPEGRGNGPAAPSLHPRPRDFTGGVFKLKSLAGAHAPSQRDMRLLLNQGMPGTSMPGWAGVLTEVQMNAVADYVLAFGPHTTWSSDDSADALTEDAMSKASVEAGKQLYDDLGCASCHGPGGQGDGTSAGDLKDVWNQPDPPRDLTAPWTFRGGYSAEVVYARIAFGISGTPMPGYLEVADPVQISSVVKYVASIARTPPWLPKNPPHGTPPQLDPAQRGRYLVQSGMCGLCHTPVDAHGIYLADTHYLAGGMKVEAGAHGIFFASNLTSDNETGLGTWTVEQIAIAIRSGHTPRRRLNLWGMPWMMFGALTHDDALAIATYLKTLPPVRNQIPEPLHYGLVETVARKLTYAWPALVPDRLSYFPGNYGYAEPPRLPLDAPQRWLVWTQIGVCIVGGVLWLLLPPAHRDLERSGGLRALAFVLIGVIAGAAILIYKYPAVGFLPAAQVINAIDATVPVVATDTLEPGEAALIERGRYLYRTSSCAFCHNGNGAGGAKMSWRVFGTTWARNLTTDLTGLKIFTDPQVRRALISGLTRDARPMHWQAMTWDHLSNLSMEDQYALVAYLRRLPPIEHKLQPGSPPYADDCASDTFWAGETNSERGCR
jgi:mono/diheme cytochrome c family protein